MTEQFTEYDADKQQAIAELKEIIRKNIREDGLEATTVDIGVSVFQSEAIIHELLCLIIATQRLLVEKGIATPEELDKMVSETLESHTEAVNASMEANKGV